MLTLDGSHGEGGGQILRTALSLAVLLGRPVSLTRVRADRPKPGLRPQHQTVVQALAAVSDALVTGDTPGSTELAFTPRGLRGGEHRFDIGAIRGSAGSVTLLFPQSSAAHTWVAENLPADRMMFGEGVAIEHRYAPAILDGITDAGLSVHLL